MRLADELKNNKNHVFYKRKSSVCLAKVSSLGTTYTNLILLTDTFRMSQTISYVKLLQILEDDFHISLTQQ